MRVSGGTYRCASNRILGGERLRDNEASASHPAEYVVGRVFLVSKRTLLSTGLFLYV